MMIANKDRYTDEFRREAADYVLQSGKTTAQAADEMGVNKKTLSRRVCDRRRQLADPAGCAQAKAEDAELMAARKRIRELEMEAGFLKKAAAFFAKGRL